MGLRNITKIVRNMNLYKNRVKNINLNDNELEIARYLTKHKEGLSQNELASYLCVDKALVTRMIRHLEKEGYVNIFPNTYDARKKIIKTTSKADELKLFVRDEELEFYNAIISVLDESEKEKLNILIEKIYIESKRLRKTNFEDLKK